MTRVESPSSINTFNLCKRKYYYSYKLNLPKRESIHTITGKAVHSALEEFFHIDLNVVNKENYEVELKQYLMSLFNKYWSEFLNELLKLEVDKSTIRSYYQESINMLRNFIDDFLDSLRNELNSLSFEDAFNKLKPQTEVFLSSENYKVQGYLDAVLNLNGDVYILDYKTGKHDDFSDDYKLQLGIYALMFREVFGKLPSKVGLHFLRHGTKKFMDVDENLLSNAQKECELIQLNTVSDDIVDYDKNPGPWCKWKEGQCSFYDLCFRIKKLEDFEEKKEEEIIQVKEND